MRRGVTYFLAAIFSLNLSLSAAFVPAAGEQSKRREAAMKSLCRKPFPKDGGWFYVGQALANYWTGNAAKGDEAIMDLASRKVEREQEGADSGFHWQAYQVARIILLFGQNGAYAPGRMSPEAEKAAKQVLWTWLEPRARAALVEPDKDWWIWGSENHHLQMWGSMWGLLNVFARDPEYSGRKFRDGSTVPQLKKAFDEYFKRWLRERATRGLFVECGSPTYAKYSLGVMYNFVDFSDDPDLARLATNFLDLCWAQWALEQIDGKRGGSRHRCYPGDPAILESADGGLTWFHFGVGEPSVHPGTWCTATSSYAPPQLVSDIARERPKLGAYQITSRQPGLADAGIPKSVQYGSDPKDALFQVQGNYHLDPNCGSLLRKTYATPDFILGASMVPALKQNAWTSISSQNRWDGVLFAGPRSLRIFVQPQKAPKGSYYNAQWSVMDQGALIIQRLKESTATTNRVFFSEGLTRTEKDGWIFVEAPQAYAAVKVVAGGWKWEEDSAAYWREKFKPGLGTWLVPEKEFTPIIMEMASKTAYATMEQFQKAILANPLRASAKQVEYTSQHYQTTLTLSPDYSAPPQINHVAVNYDAPLSFDSPMLQSKFGSDEALLKAFGQTHVFSFK